MIPAERLYLDYFATCTCPKVWHGIVPPTCSVHNPSPTTWTTTTYPTYRVPYKCPTCRKRYLPSDMPVSCTVAHGEGDCCHYGEQRVDKKGRPK